MTVRAARRAPVRLVLIDDHEMIRRGLASLLASAPDLFVVGEASSAVAGLSLVAAEQPDVVVIDVVLPDRDGIAVCREIRTTQPEVGCLLLTAHDEPEAQLAAVLSGAAGYLTKNQPESVMLEAIRLIADGKTMLDPAVTADVLAGLRADAGGAEVEATAPMALTSREQGLLALVSERRSDAEIAARLTLSERAVRTRIAVLFAKIGLARRISGDVHGQKMVYRRATDL